MTGCSVDGAILNCVGKAGDFVTSLYIWNVVTDYIMLYVFIYTICLCKQAGPIYRILGRAQSNII